MRKIFDFNAAEAASRAEAARRHAERDAALAAEAERRRKEGERAAERERELNVWLEREAAAEAAQKREERIRLAMERPPEVEKPLPLGSVEGDDVAPEIRPAAKGRYWIAINGPTCAMYPLPLKNPVVSPVPEKLLGFSTYDLAQLAQHLCLTAPMDEVRRFLETLRTDVRAGRIAVIRPKNPEPPTKDQTIWMEAEPTEPQH